MQSNDDNLRRRRAPRLRQSNSDVSPRTPSHSPPRRPMAAAKNMFHGAIGSRRGNHRGGVPSVLLDGSHPPEYDVQLSPLSPSLHRNRRGSFQGSMHQSFSNFGFTLQSNQPPSPVKKKAKSKRKRRLSRPLNAPYVTYAQPPSLWAMAWNSKGVSDALIVWNIAISVLILQIYEHF